MQRFRTTRDSPDSDKWQTILTTRRLSLRTSNRSVLYLCAPCDTLASRSGKSITLSAFKVRRYVSIATLEISTRGYIHVRSPLFNPCSRACSRVQRLKRVSVWLRYTRKRIEMVWRGGRGNRGIAGRWMYRGLKIGLHRVCNARYYIRVCIYIRLYCMYTWYIWSIRGIKCIIALGRNTGYCNNVGHRDFENVLD